MINRQCKSFRQLTHEIFPRQVGITLMLSFFNKRLRISRRGKIKPSIYHIFNEIQRTPTELAKTSVTIMSSFIDNLLERIRDLLWLGENARTFPRREYVGETGLRFEVERVESGVKFPISCGTARRSCQQPMASLPGLGIEAKLRFALKAS